MDFIFSSPATVMLTALFLLPLVPAVAGDGYDFFYFVQEWPGSLCDGKDGCCFPRSGMPPEEFLVAGLYPARRDGSTPTACDHGSLFERSEIAGLYDEMLMRWPSLSCPTGGEMRQWAREWVERGTCSEGVLGQHSYFAAALQLRQQIDLLSILRNAGIEPDGRMYYLSELRVAIQRATGGQIPGFMCNADESGVVQLQRVLLCADEKGRRLVGCRLLPRSNCLARVKFPVYFYAPPSGGGLLQS